MTLLELRRKLGETVHEARAMLDAAPGGMLTAEDETRYNKFDADITALEANIKRLEDTEAREKSLGSPVTAPILENPKAVDSIAEARKARKAELRKFLGPNTPSSTREFRALQADTDTAGGYLFEPEDFVAELIKAVDNQTFIYNAATVHNLTDSDSIGFPSLDADPADPDWTTEVASVGFDSTMALGKRVMKPAPLTKAIKVSNTLMRISAIDPEALVRNRLAYKFAVAVEKGCLVGTGSGQPLGLFTASADGITTARDVAGGNTTAILADDLFNVLYSVIAPVQEKGTWVFHRDGIKQIRKLKDSQNRYLWEPALTNGQPANILGRPYFQSEYAPNTFTTGLYVGVFGDMSFYWIAQALNFTLQRLNELYAATNQTGFIGRMELDGAPVLASAFARLKLA